MSFNGMIEAIGSRQAGLNAEMERVGQIEDPVEQTMATMKLTQKMNAFSLAVESFNKCMQKQHDARMSSIQGIK